MVQQGSGSHNNRKKRRAYLDDFTRAADGSYIYTGITYDYQGQRQDLRRRTAALGGVSAVMLATAVACGCVSVPGMGRCFYVVLPYCLSLIAAASLAWGAGRLIAGGVPLRAYVYDVTVKQFSLRYGLTAIGAAAALIGEAVYLLLNGAEGMVFGAVLFLICQGLLLAGVLVWRRVLGTMDWLPSD